MDLTAWQWILLALGAFFSGLSKTGIAGVSVLTVALFANALPARASTGALLPLLLCGDVFGVAFYRKHASWSHLWKLFPWVILGVVLGYFALGRVSNVQVQRMMGAILLAMVGLHLWRQRQTDELGSVLPHTGWFAAITGLLAGFTTMVANAAGPVMVLYLLAIGLPKLAFIG
ncbi:MAG TPA: sulfite exporter TauE/SafE family protein, partial [Bacillota bacterium]|nr:sulfite exporter TauE/SafE family protein [Bacillota bacterium]